MQNCAQGVLLVCATGHCLSVTAVTRDAQAVHWSLRPDLTGAMRRALPQFPAI